MIAGDVQQFGRRVPYAEMVARIDAITKKEIQAVSVAKSFVFIVLEGWQNERCLTYLYTCVNILRSI